MQWNPLQFGGFNPGFAGGPLLLSAVLEEIGVCGRGALHDARKKWDPNRHTDFIGELRQPRFSDRKAAPSGWNCFLLDWFGAAFTCLLGLAERGISYVTCLCAAAVANDSDEKACGKRFKPESALGFRFGILPRTIPVVVAAVRIAFIHTIKHDTKQVLFAKLRRSLGSQLKISYSGPHHKKYTVAHIGKNA